MIKILMFGWEFPPHITGGLGTACFGLTKGLLKNNVSVFFVVPKVFGGECQDYVRLVNASDVIVDIYSESEKHIWEKLYYYEINSQIIPYTSPEYFISQKISEIADKKGLSQSVFSRNFEFKGGYGPNLFEEVSRYALVAAKLSSQLDFDIIHAHDWLTYPAGIAAKQVSGKPLIIHVHATEFDRSGENVNQAVYDIERMGMHSADVVITVSNYTRNIVIERYGVCPEKVYTVHNAVEPDIAERKTYQKTIDEKIVTFLGRVTYQKGPEYFVEAAYKVLQKDQNVRFVMAGSGDMLHKMVRRVAQLKISNRFHFTGFLKGEEVQRMFALSDVYVMPSVSEPFGISPLEAMRSNVPVIISKQSGVAEVLKHAIKVDFWDIDAIADSIYGILHYPALSKMFQKYGKEEVNNLKWDNAAFEVRKIYENVLRNYYQKN